MNDKQLLLLTKHIINPHRHLDSEEKILVNSCPQEIIKYIVLNQISTSFSHILSCSKCQRGLSKNFIINLGIAHGNNCLSRERIEEFSRTLAKDICQNIKMVVLKKNILWRKYSTDTLFRVSLDLDLLVKKEDLNFIENYFLNKGFKVKYNSPGREREFIRKDGCIVDIHLNIVKSTFGKISPFPKEIVEQISRELYETSKRNRNGYYYPLPEYNLLNLLLHFILHNRSRGLRHLYDFDQILSNKRIKWSNFLILLQRFHIVNYFHYIFKMSNKVYGTKIERPIRSSLSQRLAELLNNKFDIGQGFDLKEWRNAKKAEKRNFYLIWLLWEKNIIAKAIYLISSDKLNYCG